MQLFKSVYLFVPAASKSCTVYQLDGKEQNFSIIYMYIEHISQHFSSTKCLLTRISVIFLRLKCTNIIRVLLMFSVGSPPDAREWAVIAEFSQETPKDLVRYDKICILIQFN